MTTEDLTINDLQRAFGVTGMTVHNWRKGSPQRPPLPTTTNGRSVRFKRASTIRWAKKAGVAIVDESVFTATGTTVPRGKPGPKPGLKPK